METNNSTALNAYHAPANATQGVGGELDEELDEAPQRAVHIGSTANNKNNNSMLHRVTKELASKDVNTVRLQECWSAVRQGLSQHVDEVCFEADWI